MNSFLKYPGGKFKELQIIKEFLPIRINRYFEPFVGGGSVYLNLKFKPSFINDKSIDLINLYKFVKSNNNLFKKRLIEINDLWSQIELNITEKIFKEKHLDYTKFNKFLELSKIKKKRTVTNFEKSGVNLSKKDKDSITLTTLKTAFYMLIREIYNTTNDNIEKTVSFYFLREYCYSSMYRFSKKGYFNVPYGGRSYNSKTLTEKIVNLFSDDTRTLLLNTEIYCNDFEYFLNMFKFNENDFIFLDPPYDTNFSTYDNNLFDQKEQVRLRDFLSNMKAKWMIVIKETQLIKELYKGFDFIKYDKNYSVSFKNRNERNVEHLIITNYKLKKGKVL